MALTVIALNVLALIILAPVILPPVPPPLTMLPPYTLPAALTNPAVKILPAVILLVTLNPVGVNTATLPTVLTEIVTLELAPDIATLLLPLNIVLLDVVTPVNNAPLPRI